MSDARPMAVRIADDFRVQILSGSLSPGERLPSIAEIQAKFGGCSTTTVRNALEDLRDQGLIDSIKGKGSFVRQRPTARRHGIDRYRKSIWGAGKSILTAEAEAQGHEAHQVVRELAEVPAPVEVANRLGIPEGTAVWVRRRTTFINGRPNQLADSYYPLDVIEKAPAIRQEDTGPGGGFARLEDAGFLLAEIEEDWHARAAIGNERAELKLPAGTPVIEVLRTTFDSTGRPVEVMHAVLAADMTRFSYRFAVPE